MVSKLSILFTTAILFLLAIISPVAASDATDLLDKLYSRVDKNTTAIDPSIVPPTCAGVCSSSVLGVYTACTSDACACKDDDSNEITACMNCLVQQNTLQQPIANAIQKDYVRICANMGFTVKNNVSAGSRSIGVSIGLLVGTALVGIFVVV